MGSGTRRKHWTVVATRSASGGEAVRNVAAQGFPYYHPKYRSPPVRMVRRAAPLFPGYLFVQIRHDNWHPLRGTRDVKYVFMSSERPALVHDFEIERLRSLENELGYIEPEWTQPPAFALNEHVEAQRGIFKDKIGRYQGLAGNSAQRVRVLFEILGRELEHEISAFDLVATSPAA